MPILADIAYHLARERACRGNAIAAENSDIAARHSALADLHAGRRSALEQELDTAPARRRHLSLV